MFVVNLPVPKNCYECPMCQIDTGGCTLSELDPSRGFNAGMYSNVIMMASDIYNNLKKNINKKYIAEAEGITIEDVDEVLKSNGKHPDCPIQKWHTECYNDFTKDDLGNIIITLESERLARGDCICKLHKWLDMIEDACEYDNEFLRGVIHDVLKARQEYLPHYQRTKKYDAYDLANLSCKDRKD